MKLLVVGGGGREHAIIKKLKENPDVDMIYALPGNGGIARDAVCVPEIGAKEIDKIVDFAVSHKIDFAVVAPDDPLAMGCVDKLHKAGIACFGPDAKAARIESSKVFAKNLMREYKIPTADYQVFDHPEAARKYLKTVSYPECYPVVIKADGLALGKGVTIARTPEEAEAAVKSVMEERIFGDSGGKIVIEEYLTGPEVSVLAFTDGITIRPMVSSMDHKRAGDGDTGPNTGGMGTVAPNPYYTPEIAKICMKEIFLPTLKAMREKGCPFKGCLYFGLMITEKGPKVIEYNCRFGDPETQVVLPLMKTDLLSVMMAAEEERLSDMEIEWLDWKAACVILASGGYPGKYETGKEISFKKQFPENVTCYHAGDKLKDKIYNNCHNTTYGLCNIRGDGGNIDADKSLVTSGGRVLGITAVAPDLRTALKNAYAAADTVEFDGKYARRDIGRRALEAESV